MRLFGKFLADESGATAIEYGLIAAGISVAIITVVNTLGTDLKNTFTNVSTSLKGLAANGLVTIARTPGGRAEAVDLTAEGRKRVAALPASCE